MNRLSSASAALLVWSLGVVTSAYAVPYTFSTGNPDGRMASAARPGAGGKFEIESADDFVLTRTTQINQVTFTGLLTGTAPSVNGVRVEIYRVFPVDSNVGRTSGPPTFSTPRVPTRVNSPSDVAFQERDNGDLIFAANMVNSSFTANNSVQPGGIHPQPGQTTGGNGPVTGAETQFVVNLTNSFVLPANHYFFVPQVDVSGGEFLWLSAPKPIVPPGTAFPPGTTDLQSWTRDQFLDPDWLRIGTDIVGGNPAPTFNATFSLTGSTVSEPATSLLIAPIASFLFVIRAKLRKIAT
jgi:hypothetical protein